MIWLERKISFEHPLQIPETVKIVRMLLPNDSNDVVGVSVGDDGLRRATLGENDGGFGLEDWLSAFPVIDGVGLDCGSKVLSCWRNRTEDACEGFVALELD